MGRPSSITNLPEDIRIELKKRLFECNFSNYEGHAEWLEELGYTVSKSAIHRFAQNVEGSPNHNLRLRCAEIAANYSTADTIIANAKAILRWVKPHSV